MRRAFSIIEVLVTIAVIVLLLAIALPALLGARGRASRVASLNNARQCHGLIATYAAQNADRFPAAEPGVLYPGPAPGVQLTIAPWFTATSWPHLLGDLAPWWDHQQTYLAPGAARASLGQSGPLGTSSYAYADTSTAPPELWTDRPPTALLEGAAPRPPRIADATFPSAKVVLWDWEQPYLRRVRAAVGPDLAESTPTVFIDGHGDERRPSDATPAYPNPVPDLPYPTTRLHNTPEGIRGRDY